MMEKNKNLIMEDYKDITKFSFIAFLGVLYYAFALMTMEGTRMAYVTLPKLYLLVYRL